MRQVSAVALLVAIGVTVVSCSDDDGPGQFRYPMGAGMEWYYTRTQARAHDTATFIDYLMQTVVRIGPTVQIGALGNGTAFEISDDGHYYGSQFYQNREDGLYSVGNCGTPAIVSPKRSLVTLADPIVVSALEAADMGSFESCDGRPIVGDGDTPLALPYPFRVGQDWLYREVEELSLEIRKVNRGWDAVQVGAGKFDAYQIEWYYIPGPASLHIVDDICAFGLVRRTITSDSVEVTTPEHPEGTGEFETWIETLSLDSLKR